MELSSIFFALDADSQNDVLKKSLDVLAKDDRFACIAVLLMDYHGLSAEQVREVTRLSRTTIYDARARGLAKLRTLIDAEIDRRGLKLKVVKR